MALSHPVLRRCAGRATDRFAGDYWGRRPLLTERDGTGFDDLLSLADVDELLSRRGLRTPFLRVVRGGAAVVAGEFTGSGGIGAEVGDQIADDRLLGLLDGGATLVLQGLHRLWSPIIDFAGALGADLGHPVQVNAYVTPPATQGLSTHYDVHDVFVLQVAGQKRWVVHEPVHPLPLRSQPSTGRRAEVARAARGAPALDVVLRPGDALYLPRGWLHAAEALGEVSLHLTVGIHAITRYALVEALVALAADEPALRESLPLRIDLADAGALADELAETVRALVKRVQDATPEEVAVGLRSAVWPGTRPAPLAPLAQAAAIQALAADTVVKLREGLRYRLGPAGDRVRLELADRTITFPGAVRPALVAILDGGPALAGGLPGLDPDDRLVLVRRLLREAVVVPAP